MSELSNFTGRCIDKESIEEYVMHEVYAEGEDGVKYVLNVVAQDPMHAIEVARFVKQEEGWRVEQ
jgi:hypothetical protein